MIFHSRPFQSIRTSAALILFACLTNRAEPGENSSNVAPGIEWIFPREGSVLILGQDAFESDLQLITGPQSPTIPAKCTCRISLRYMVQKSDWQEIYRDDSSWQVLSDQNVPQLFHLSMHTLGVGTYSLRAELFYEDKKSMGTEAALNFRVQNAVESAVLSEAQSGEHMFVVGLLRVRNAEASIEAVLRSMKLYTDAIMLLDDASEDETLAVVQELKEECRVLRIREKKEFGGADRYADMEMLLTDGREEGGTHFVVLHSDELLTTSLVAGDALWWKALQSLNKGDSLTLPWFHLWKSLRFVHAHNVSSKQSACVRVCAY